MTMQARMTNPAMVLPHVMEAIQGLYRAMNAGGAPQRTMELVHLRASQINGCSACVHGGVTGATAAGESTDRLLALAAWYESPLFDEAERAALTLTEAATRLSDRPGQVTDEIWADAAKHYDEKQLAAIILMIATTNFFNRVNTTIKEPAGATWS
jgi:AhpD family alkylhydroperoxidase